VKVNFEKWKKQKKYVGQDPNFQGIEAFGEKAKQTLTIKTRTKKNLNYFVKLYAAFHHTFHVLQITIVKVIRNRFHEVGQNKTLEC